MFRSSLRSVPDTFRANVCFNCIARGLRGRAQARAFRATPLQRSSHQSHDNENSDQRPRKNSKQGVREVPPVRSLEEALQDLSETLEPKGSQNVQKPLDLKEYSQPQGAPDQQTYKGINVPTGSGEPTNAQSGKPGVESSLDGLISDIDKTVEKASEKKSTGTQSAQKNNNVRGGFVQPPHILAKSITSQQRGKLQNTIKPRIQAIKEETPPVPRLSFGLERVLFNPGVYHLRDPRSHVFNFDPYLGSIMPVTEFDFAALKEYITSSRDETLRKTAIKHKKKYMGSSSSMTGVLSHFHYLLSAWRPVNTSTLSTTFSDDLKTFTRLLRAPSAMFLRYQDGVYAIDADKEFDSANILMNLGKSMEKLLTLPKEDFERYRRSHTNKVTPEEEAKTPESYHYSSYGNFMMRSQLDAYDPRLPGTGMFDLKTRAVVSIRMDAQNFEGGLGYQIRSRFGKYESYEREYYDMIRAAFLKYSLQVRIGRMDGIFVAFHNIERIFGFQYISLPEMDNALHGQWNTVLGDTEFRLSLQLWNKILDKATAKYPGRSLRFHFETRATTASGPFMYIFYEPVTEEEIQQIQTRNKAEIDAYQQRVLNLPKNSSSVSSDSEDTEETKFIEEEETVDDETPDDDTAEDVEDETPVAHVGEVSAGEFSAEGVSAEEASPEQTSTEQALPEQASTEQTSTEQAPTQTDAASEPQEREVSAIYLTINNYQNGQRVERPEDFRAHDLWTVRYQMSDLEGPKVQSLYEACMRRRQNALETAAQEPQSNYLKKLKRLSQRGRDLSRNQDERDKQNGVTVLDDVKT
ncbi:mitochondrial protein Pet127-domain-containing protein [Aspergillus unguis]